MTLYLLILTLHAGMSPTFYTPEGARLDTLASGAPVYHRALVVSGPCQAAAEMLRVNHWVIPGQDQWAGELFQVDQATRTLRRVELPKIRATSDTLTMSDEGYQMATEGATDVARMRALRLEP